MILLTADWHIKLGQKNVPKQWAKHRYRRFFQQIQQIENVQLHIVPGDIFDRTPTLQQLQLYFQFVANTKHKTILSTGNHQAITKSKSFFKYLKQVTKILNPLVEVVDQILTQQYFHIVPYQFIKKKQTWQSLQKDRVVFTHVRGQIPPHVKSQIPLQWLQQFPTVYAGDLHSHSNTQRNIVYPGSPMTTSFHRGQTNTGYILINSQNMTQWQWKAFDLPQLIRRTVSSQQQMIPTNYHHTIYQITGDVGQLSKIKDSQLLDKKVVKRNKQTALILTPQMTMSTQLSQYLQYILMIDQDKTKQIVGVFHDYIKDSQLQ